jgi:hypothetical protein
VQIKVYFFEQLKNGEAFGVRLSWQPLSPTLSFIQVEGKAAPVPQHSKISTIFLSSRKKISCAFRFSIVFCKTRGQIEIIIYHLSFIIYHLSIIFFGHCCIFPEK